MIDHALRTETTLPYGEAIDRLVGELMKEGFGVLTEVDVRATLDGKIVADFRKCVILRACNSLLAY